MLEVVKIKKKKKIKQPEETPLFYRLRRRWVEENSKDLGERKEEELVESCESTLSFGSVSEQVTAMFRIPCSQLHLPAPLINGFL